jgi:hypothetical protein
LTHQPITKPRPRPPHPPDPITPLPTPPLQHRVFTVYNDRAFFTYDSGATYILLRSSDSSILSDYVPCPDFAAKPGFEVANSSYIYPIATDLLHILHTHIALTTYVFNDADLSGNLFGLAPLVNLGYTATYSRYSLSIADDHHQTVIYGTKSPSADVWRFSLPRHQPHSARIVVRHEQDAELVLYTTASLGFPTYKTMYHATNMG